MIEEGTILQERYRIGEQIGQGGMGAVYLATDERFGSTVAIKETLFTDEHFKKAFKREARLLNSLKHSSLPKVSDHFIEDTGQYIVMEYIAGDDLADTIEKTGKAFQLSDVLMWAEQLLDTLEYLHSQENPIIHRDIKPQNLKLTPEGQVILLDFGLAKGNPTDANHQTAANSIFGYSRNYASLEQIQGTGTDPRSDLYSLAATIYHLVTGSPPSDALTRVMMVLNEEKDPLVKASDVHEQVPESLGEVLLLAMSLNANQRPQTAAEMREFMVEGNDTAAMAKRNTASSKPLETNFFSQDTKVMLAESTTPSGLKTERKTEVLPSVAVGNESVMTRLANPETSARAAVTNVVDENRIVSGVITRSFGSRTNMLGSAVAGLMLLVGSVAAVAYFMGSDTPDPDLLKSKKQNVSSNVTDHSITTSIDETANTKVLDKESEFKVEDVPAAPDITENADKKIESKPPQRPKKVGKTVKKTEKAKPKKREQIVKYGDITIKDGNIITKDGLVIRKDGKFEKNGRIVDPGRIRARKPRFNPSRPPMNRSKFERLSPAEKRKVRKALETWRVKENKRRKAAGLPAIPRRKVRGASTDTRKKNPKD